MISRHVVHRSPAMLPGAAGPVALFMQFLLRNSRPFCCIALGFADHGEAESRSRLSRFAPQAGILGTSSSYERSCLQVL